MFRSIASIADITQATVITVNTLQQRITALDRSNEDAVVQITEAFEILEINSHDAQVTWSSEDAEKQRSIGSGPKEEWFMRWLLKRLNVEEIQEQRYRNTSSLRRCTYILLYMD